jgi:hypothetical protein
MAIVSICPTRSVVANWEPNLRTYRVTYQVVTNDPLDGPGKVLSEMSNANNGLGVTYIVRQNRYAFGNDSDPLAVLISLGAPRRAGGDKLTKIWLVDGTYEFDLEKQPALRPVKIEPYYVQGTEPIESAGYYGAYNRVNGQWIGPKEFGPGQETYSQAGGVVYPIGNSANVPILPAPEREVSTPAYRVSWYKQTALDASFYINTWNSGAFTLVSNVVIYNAITGATQIAPVFFKTFQSGTLRLRDVQQPTVNIYGQEWFNVTLEFIEEDIYLHELDRGLSARARPGDPDGRGGTYSQGDFPEGSSGQREILDADGQPVSDPVLLDGTGKPLRDQSLSLPAIYLRWLKNESTNFNELNIGAWQ